ncbi:MAG: hypothetical protein ACLSH6_09875 [Limosilactobacillus pontis]
MARLNMNDVQAVIAYLDRILGVNFIVCGRRSAYVRASDPVYFQGGYVSSTPESRQSRTSTKSGMT